MKLGVRLPHFNKIADDPGVAPAQIVAVAQRVEELGFDSVWVGDHIAQNPASAESYGTTWYEALTTLSYVAAVTSRVRLGTSVLVAPFRHPLLTAKMLSTLDALSGGRVDAGFGTGSMESEFTVLGLDNFKERGQVTDDIIDTVKRVCAGATSTAEGVEFLFSPLPVQRDGIPIWIGGNSKRACRRVVDFADGWMLVRPTVDEFSTAVERMHALCQSRDRDPATITLGVEHPLLILDEPTGADNGFIGSTSEIIDHLRRFAACGMTSVLFDMHFSSPELNDMTVERMLDGIERFAANIMPRIEG